MNSSNSLFHFTRKISSLKSILNGSIYGTYCKEILNHNNEKVPIIVPMISFTDMPLINYAKKPVYGKFGIGLKKSWGIDNGLNPVLYIEKKSILFDEQVKAYKSSLSTLKILNSSTYNTQNDLNTVKKPIEFIKYLLFYFKHYEDDLYRESINKLYKNYRFYDEREWRFIPDSECPICDFKMTIKEYDDWRNSNKTSKPLLKEKISLKFDFSDIDWILVQNKKQIKSVIKLLNTFDDKYFQNVEKEILFTKIITFEDINK